MDPDGVVMASGGVEIMLGAGLAVLTRDRVLIGRLLAAFFVAVFPGNLAQFIHERDGFGLDTDARRFVRLLFQPLLVLWALWSTVALRQVTAGMDRRHSKHNRLHRQRAGTPVVQATGSEHITAEGFHTKDFRDDPLLIRYRAIRHG